MITTSRHSPRLQAPAREILELAIAPGKAAGAFRLGMAINEAIAVIEARPQAIPFLQFKYNDEVPEADDLVLRLPENGITLRFDPVTQRLRVIEIWTFDSLRLTYGGIDFSLSSGQIVATFALVYKIFGPTYPGWLDQEAGLYVLGYPGIEYCFEIPAPYHPLYQSSNLPMVFPDGTTPVCKTIFIATPSIAQQTGPDGSEIPKVYKWQSSTALRYPILPPGHDVRPRPIVKSVLLKPSQGAKLQLSSPVRSETTKFITSTVEIIFGKTTSQDALADLGPPDSTFTKCDERMKIHANTMEPVEHGTAYTVNNAAVDGNEYVFWNWFRYGFDILFESVSGTACKIVVHSNAPGHHAFDRYHKCMFEVEAPGAQATAPPAVVSVNSTWDDVEAKFGTPIGPAIILHRSGTDDPFLPSSLRGYPGIIFEVLRNGRLAGATVFDE